MLPRSRLLLQCHRVFCSTGAQQLVGRHAICSAAAAGFVLQLGGFAEKAGPRLMDMHLPFQLSMAARFLTSAGSQQQQQPQQQPQPLGKGEKPQAEAFDSLELTDEKINAITDKIPQRPVGVVEGTSYSVIILAAFGALAYFIYNFVTNLLLDPVQQQCFNTALEKLRADPRITVRLGSSITGYGQETANRAARQVIPHQVYKDANGVEHVRLQFHMRGPGGNALVSADMFRGEGGQWDYTYLIVDVVAGSSSPQRLNIVMPR